MVKFVFSNNAEKIFNKIPSKVQERIVKKIKELKTHPDILSCLKRLNHFEPATHRLRIGNYRLILELKTQENENFKFLVLDFGDRKSIYK